MPEEKCFENAAELVDFFNGHKDEIAAQYERLISMERSKDLMKKKSCAYFAVMDCIYAKGLTATDCQINKMAELVVFDIEDENKKEAI